MEIQEYLKKSNYFAGLSSDGADALADICKIKSFKKKENLFIEQDRGISIFILTSGSIQLYKTNQEGKDTVINIMKPGDLFGEVVLFESPYYPVSAIVLEHSEVIVIPKIAFLDLLENNKFRNDFITVLMKKMRFLATRIHDLSAHDVEERFFRFIHSHYGIKEAYTIDISKKDFAAAVGTIPETFSRLLKRLKKEEKIDWTGNTLKVLRIPEEFDLY